MSTKQINVVEAKIELERIAELQKYKDEFEKLGVNDWGAKDFLAIIIPFVLLLIVENFYVIESDLFKMIYVIFLVSALVQVMIAAQAKKTNRRIDLLLKIIKHGQKGDKN